MHVKVGMLIRRPPEDVFEAFADPAITTRFWFTKSSGRLEPCTPPPSLTVPRTTTSPLPTS